MNLFYIFCALSYVFSLHAVEIINTPGEYLVGSSISFDPAAPNDAIFLINTNNVVLNLNRHTLSQDSTNTQTNITGIEIAPNIANVTIKNGSVKDLSGYGIRIGDGCSTISILGMNVMGCTRGGIFFDGLVTGTGITNGYLDNVICINSKGNNAGPAFGLRMVYTVHTEVFFSNFDYNDGSLTTSGYGIMLENCKNCEFMTGQANDNAGALFTAGAYLYKSHSCIFKDYISQNNVCKDISNTGTAAGFYFNQSLGTFAWNVKAASNVATNGYGYGFIALNSASSTYHETLSAANKGSAVGAGYAVINSSNSTISESSARLNAGTAGIGYGILLDNSNVCDIRENRLVSNVGASGYGLRDTVTNSTNLILSNFSFKNTTTGFDVVRTDGGALPVAHGTVSNFDEFNTKSKFHNIAIS